MSGKPPTSADDASLALILGEMRGQLREVVHSTNNLSTKFDALTREVIGLGALAKEVVELKTHQDRQQKEIEALKNERERRAGAVNLVEWVVKHWPGVIGFFVLIGVLLKTEGYLP